MGGKTHRPQSTPKTSAPATTTSAPATSNTSPPASAGAGVSQTPTLDKAAAGQGGTDAGKQAASASTITFDLGAEPISASAITFSLGMQQPGGEGAGPARGRPAAADASAKIKAGKGTPVLTEAMVKGAVGTITVALGGYTITFKKASLSSCQVSGEADAATLSVSWSAEEFQSSVAQKDDPSASSWKTENPR